MSFSSQLTNPAKADALSPARPAVELCGVTKHFGTTVALSNVSLTIVEGEFFSVLGPSGSGKTTLLRLIAGLDEPGTGELRIRGEDSQGILAGARPISMVFQSHALFPHLTVSENIFLGLRIRNVARAEMAERVKRTAELLQITGLVSRMPDAISGGERQRVALARALVTEPAILLLDEPLGSLDAPLRRQLQTELRALQRRSGITFVYVTHDQDDALAMSDRVAVLNHGRVEQVGAPRTLYDAPRTRFVAQFLGSCNLLRAKVLEIVSGKARVQTPMGELTMLASVGANVGDELTVAIRPERIVLGRLAQPNSFQTVLEASSFRGAAVEYQLSKDGLPLVALALNDASGPLLIAGEKVYCTLPEDAIIALND